MKLSDFSKQDQALLKAANSAGLNYAGAFKLKETSGCVLAVAVSLGRVSKYPIRIDIEALLREENS